MLSSDVPGPFGFVLSAVLGVVIVAAWVILAGSRFVQGGVVERPERVPQLYGYTVCLVALFWALGSIISLVDNAMILSAPEYRASSEFGFEPSVTSFEAFRATSDRIRQMTRDPREPSVADSTPEPEQRRRFEALRADRIQRARFEARREIIKDVLSLLIAGALFVWHWRWLRRRAVVAAPV
jgi:hypothetical protein